ncbi:hypothetical protein PLICRDRAFT_508271 [Plicaturopsis crispa FD-325 SS-3]|nr:hypothetical protein PLICRDRAFT_508271 [Plicaturopsis crispa FD-325 SS-3]
MVPSPSLEYPLTRAYPWRWFTAAAIASSVAVLLIITLVNVATVGYDTITVLRPDLNATRRYWWSPFVVDPHPTCDEHIFLQDDTFRTNISTFDYTVYSLLQPTATGATEGVIEEWNQYAFSYSALPLNSFCGVSNIAPLSVIVDRARKHVQGSVSLMCMDPSGLSMQLFQTYDTYLFFSPPSNGGWYPSDPSAGPIMQRTLDSMASDLLVSTLAFSSTSPTALDGVRADGFAYCPSITTYDDSKSHTPSDAERAACDAAPVQMSLRTVSALYANDTVGSINATLPAGMRDAVLNYFQVLNAASLGDIGLWRANSLFAAPAMVNATIAPNDDVSAALRNNSALGKFYNYLDGNVSAGAALRAATPFGVQEDEPLVIPIPNASFTPAVIAVSYLCHDLKIKGALSFIISVVVADASMFAAFWGTLTFIAAAVARRRSVEGECTDSLCCRR